MGYSFIRFRRRSDNKEKQAICPRKLAIYIEENPEYISSMATQRRSHYPKQAASLFLEGALFALLLARFALPFFHSPLHHRYSDMLTYWNCALTFSHQTHFCAMVPKGFQVWLILEQKAIALFPHWNAEYIVGAASGLLCAALPWIWYRVSREIMPKKAALMTAIIIGILPQLAAIYNYFIAETLFLVLLGLAFWMTLRAARKGTFAAYDIAVVCWVVAALTKSTALFFAFFSLGYLVYLHKEKWRLLGSAALIAALFFIPAGLHSAKVTHFFAPVKTTQSPKLYRLSHTQWIGTFNSSGEYYKFASPAYFSNPFEPIGTYQTWRLPGITDYSADLNKGAKRWDDALEQAQRDRTFMQDLLDTRDTIVYLFFGASWPEYNRSTWLGILSFHARWVWAPLLLLVLFRAPFMPLPDKVAMLLSPAWLLIVVMMFQQSVVMDGRYRKPLEPLLIVLVSLLVQRWLSGKTKKKDDVMEDFFIRVYIRHPLEFLRTNARRATRHLESLRK
jgi:hypothetical protein